MTMPILLALDSSAAASSVAVWRAGALSAHRFLPMVRGHAEMLMSLVTEAMAAAQLRFADLTHVAVTVGPGGFTGIRVGLAVARGLGLAADLPVVGVTSLAAVAEAVPFAARRARTLIVLIDSRREDLFVQAFAPDLTPLADPAAMTAAALMDWLPTGPLLLAGDGVSAARERLAGHAPRIAIADHCGPPDAAAVATLAVRRLAAGGGLPPVPLYLRPPDVRLPASVADVAVPAVSR